MITAPQLAAAIAATNGDMRRYKLRAAIEDIAGECTANALTAILEWLDDEGLTRKEARKRYITEWYGLDYVLDALRTDYPGVEFATQSQRKDGRHNAPDHVNPPKFVVVNDPDGLFDGYEFSVYDLRLRWRGSDPVPFASCWEMVYIPKQGDPVPCWAVGLEILKGNGGEVLRI